MNSHDESYYENVIRWEREREAERERQEAERKRREGIPAEEGKPEYPRSKYFYTVCSQSAPGGIPVFDRLNGDPYFHVLRLMYDGRVKEQLEKEMECFSLFCYETQTKTEMKRYLEDPEKKNPNQDHSESDTLHYPVVNDGHFFGYLVEERDEKRKISHYDSRTGRLVFVSLSGEPVPTDHFVKQASFGPPREYHYYKARRLEYRYEGAESLFAELTKNERFLFLTACHGEGDTSFPDYGQIVFSDPVYESVNGKIAFGAVMTEYTVAENEEIIRELQQYCLKQTVFQKETRLSKDPEKSKKTLILSVSSLNVLMMNHKLAGAVVCGSRMSKDGEEEFNPQLGESKCQVFIPLSGEERETDHKRVEEEGKQYVYRSFTALKKMGSVE